MRLRVTNHERHEQHEKVLFRDESYAIQGAIFEVYRELGCGFVEAVYQEGLAIEFRRRQIPFDQQFEIGLSYKDVRLAQRFRVDFVCFSSILVEIKAAKSLDDAHRAQILNYLKASGLRLGLLVNFGHYPKLEYERIVR